MIPDTNPKTIDNKIKDLQLQLIGEKNTNDHYKKAHLNFLLAYFYEQKNKLKKVFYLL